MPGFGQGPMGFEMLSAHLGERESEKNKDQTDPINLEPISPLGEASVRSLLEQYQTSLETIEKGSMRYFQWLNGWPEIEDRREIDSVAKAFQKAETLRSVLIELGQNL